MRYFMGKYRKKLNDDKTGARQKTKDNGGFTGSPNTY